jgi:hypothetical protein
MHQNTRNSKGIRVQSHPQMEDWFPLYEEIKSKTVIYEEVHYI